MKSKKLGNKGFAMASVLATFILVPISIYTYLAMFRTSIRGERTISGQFEYKNLSRSVLQVLSNQRICARSITDGQGQPFFFPSEASPEVRLGGQRIAYVGQQIGAAVISDIHFDTIFGPETVSDGFEYVVALKIEADMQRDTYGAPKLSNKENPVVLNMKTDNNGQVVSCSGSPPEGGLQDVVEAFIISNHRITFDSRRTPELVVKKGTTDDFEMVTLEFRAHRHYTLYSGLKFNPEGNHRMFGLRCKTEKGWKYTSCSEATNGGGEYVGDLWSLDGGCYSNDWGNDDTNGMELRVICTR